MGPRMTIIKPEFEADDQELKDGDKIEPQFPDDDGGGDEIEAELWPDDSKTPCTWSDNKDEWRRVFVFEKLADSDIAGDTLVKNMEAVCQWLKDGAVPKQERKLKTVKE